MYIMELAVFGFKLNLEVLILIGIVYLIVVLNTISSCSNVTGITEGFASGGVVGGTDNVVKDVASQLSMGMKQIESAFR